MDSKKLEILMTAIDLGSFTKASEVVGYTQSGLTHMMDALEREVGFSLLQRDHNGIQLSPQGRQLMPAIREFLRANAKLENRIAALIAAGNTEELARYLRKPEQGRNGKMSDDPLRQMKYSFVAYITIVSRAAIKGGMDEEEALTLSDLYCQRVDVMTQAIDILRTLYEMSLDFCRKVQQGKQGSYSPTVQKCLHYISRHLHENIRAEHLATLTGLSSKTVAERFRQETGCSIHGINFNKHNKGHIGWRKPSICCGIQSIRWQRSPAS